MYKFTSYELSRCFFDFIFENPDLVKPSHIAVYFYIIEHCNRLGWKSKFGLPSVMVREIVGIKNFRTYDRTLKDLIDWKFITLHQISKNQYSANIISLNKPNCRNIEAYNSSLDKSINLNYSISQDKQNANFHNIPEDNETTVEHQNTLDRISIFKEKVFSFEPQYSAEILNSFFEYWSEISENKLFFKAEKQTTFDIPTRLKRWLNMEIKFKTDQHGTHKEKPAETAEIISTLNAKFGNIRD